MPISTKQKTNSVSVWSLLAVPVFLLAGCGGGGGGGSSESVQDGSDTNRAPSATLIVEGVALKGAIADGLVTVHAVEEHAGYHQIAPTPLANAVRTLADGSFRIQLSSPTNSALVVRVAADDKTLMLCDVSAGCRNSRGGLVPFGNAMRLPPDFAMTAAISAVRGARVSVPVTPLTQLAFRWAENQTAGLTLANIAQGRVKVATSLDLPENILDRAPVDLTRLTANAIVDSDTLTYSLISSSFLALANDNAWTNISDVLESASQRFATAGNLIEINLGGLPEVSMSDLLQATAETAAALSATLGSSRGTGQVLGHIATASSESAAALITASEERQSLNISFHPSSKSAFPTETVTLNINADGTGPILYQWRKDGVAIAGETQQHLTLSSVSEADEGSYDCLVSNQYGSLASNAAKVEVMEAAVSLAWEPPASRADGTPLDMRDLQGYRVFYGTSEDNMSEVVKIDDPYTTRYDFAYLPSATYHFAIKAVDHDGLESQLSEPVSKTL